MKTKISLIIILCLSFLCAGCKQELIYSGEIVNIEYLQGGFFSNKITILTFENGYKTTLGCHVSLRIGHCYSISFDTAWGNIIIKNIHCDEKE